MHIKNKILATFLTVAIISVLFVAMLSFFSARGSLLRTYKNQLETLANLKSNAVQIFFDGLQNDISIAQDYYNIKTNLPIVSKFSKDRTHPDFIKAKEMLDGQLRKWLKIKEYVDDIILVGPEGKVVYAANEGHIKWDLDKALPDPEGAAFEKGKKGIFISQIFRNPHEAYGYKFALLVTAPVFDFEKQFIGVVGFEINMDPVYKFIQDTTGLEETGETLVVRKEGDHVLFLNPLRHDPDAALKRMTRLGDKTSIPAQEAANGKTGSGIVRDYRNNEVLGAWRYIPTLGWGIIAKIDLQEVLAPVFNLRNRIAVFCLVIIILVVIVSLVIAESISRPIHILHKGTEIIGSGNLDYKVGMDTKDEIGQLSRAFDQMAVDLKHTTTSLDKLNKEIAARKKAEEAVLRLAAIVESSDDAIIGKDLNNIITSWNKGAERLYGYTEKEAIGKSISIVVPEERADEPHTVMERIKNGQRMEHFETLRKKKDGTKLPISLTLSPINDADGRIVGASTIARDITERKRLEEKLKTLASHDELTGCVNFRSTMELLEKEIARSQRYQKQFSIIMADIDDFKRTNDEYGHQAGNDILVAFATVIKTSLRGIDTVGRYGGEEFMVILPETDAQHALLVLERIKNNLGKAKITSPHLDHAKAVTLKFSAGIAVFPHNAKDLKELIWVADNALLQAKRGGKDRAVLERRKLVRLSPKPGTRVEIVDSSDKGNVQALQIANISKEGMLLLSTQDIPGEEFLCRIYRPKDESPFELTCKVKHKGKSENELYHVGVYFPDIPESSKEKLLQCSESQKESVLT